MSECPQALVVEGKGGRAFLSSKRRSEKFPLYFYFSDLRGKTSSWHRRKEYPREVREGALFRPREGKKGRYMLSLPGAASGKGRGTAAAYAKIRKRKGGGKKSTYP